MRLAVDEHNQLKRSVFMFTHELYFPKNLNKKEYNYNLSHMLVHGGVHRLENKQKLFFINKRKRGIKWENKAVMKQTSKLWPLDFQYW